MEERHKRKIHDSSAAMLLPMRPIIRDDLGEATGPAIFELRKCPADRKAVLAIISTVPDHLQGFVAEAASNRNIVPRNVVALLLEVIGFERLAEQLGAHLASHLVRRFLPKDHPWFVGDAA